VLLAVVGVLVVVVDVEAIEVLEVGAGSVGRSANPFVSVGLVEFVVDSVAPVAGNSGAGQATNSGIVTRKRHARRD